MTRLTPEAYLDHIRAESARFRAVLADADPAARVPSCPDWDAADLLWHLTKVQRFWAGAVADRPAEPAEGEEAYDAERPATHPELLAAYDVASAALAAGPGGRPADGTRRGPGPTTTPWGSSCAGRRTRRWCTGSTPSWSRALPRRSIPGWPPTGSPRSSA